MKPNKRIHLTEYSGPCALPWQVMRNVERLLRCL